MCCKSAARVRAAATRHHPRARTDTRARRAAESMLKGSRAGSVAATNAERELGEALSQSSSDMALPSSSISAPSPVTASAALSAVSARTDVDTGASIASSTTSATTVSCPERVVCADETERRRPACACASAAAAALAVASCALPRAPPSARARRAASAAASDAESATLTRRLPASAGRSTVTPAENPPRPMPPPPPLRGNARTTLLIDAASRADRERLHAGTCASTFTRGGATASGAPSGHQGASE